MNYDLTYPAQVILASLYDDSVLANTIYVLKDQERGGALGQGVDVYIDILEDVTIKAYTEADKAAKNGYGNDYEFDNVTLTPINFKLGDEAYGGIILDGWDNLVFNKDNFEDFRFEIDNIARKLTIKLEEEIGEVINAPGSSSTDEIEFTTTTKKDRGSEIIEALVQVKLDFNANGVPATDRTVVAGRNVYTALVASKEIQSAANTGEEGESRALREAIVGRVAGFDIVQSDKVDADSLVAYHKEAFGLVTRAPGKNPSAPYSELIQVPEAPIDIRVNIVGMGPRMATGLYCGTFFSAVHITKDAAVRSANVRKLNFVDEVPNVEDVEA